METGNMQVSGLDSTAYLQFFTPAFSSPSIYFPLAFISPKAISYTDTTLPDTQPLFLCGMFPGTSDLCPTLWSCTEIFDCKCTACPDLAAQCHHTRWSSHTHLHASEKNPKPDTLVFNSCHQDETRCFPIKNNGSIFQMRGWGSVTWKKKWQHTEILWT